MDEPTEPTEERPAPPPTPSSAVTGPPLPRRAGEVARWTLGLGVTLALAGVLAWGGLLLAVFGLGGIALAIGAALTVAGAVVWRRGMLPLAVLALAVTLPAAGATLHSLRVDRSAGLLQVRPAAVGELDQRGTYRRGAGAVFLDLRNVTFPRGRTTRISARSDLGPVVVALPAGQCVATTIHYRYRSQYGDLFTDGATTAIQAAGLDNGGVGGVNWNSAGLTEAETLRTDRSYSGGDDSNWGLIAWGRLPAGRQTWQSDGRSTVVRGVDDPGAARLELDLAGAEQMVVRDYPASAGPLDTGWADQNDQVAGQSWPQALQAPASPGVLSREANTRIRTHRNRAAWTRWERRVIAWGAAQARRYAGPCATRAELRERAYAFDTQVQDVRTDSGRIQRLTGGPTTRRSPIQGQPVGRSENFILRAEVNGLGQVKVLGQYRANDGYFPSNSSGEIS